MVSPPKQLKMKEGQFVFKEWLQSPDKRQFHEMKEIEEKTLLRLIRNQLARNSPFQAQLEVGNTSRLKANMGLLVSPNMFPKHCCQSVRNMNTELPIFGNSHKYPFLNVRYRRRVHGTFLMGIPLIIALDNMPVKRSRNWASWKSLWHRPILAIRSCYLNMRPS